MTPSQRPPNRIAKYTIESTLGSGAMGVVYKAYDPQIERTVAIKVLHEHLRAGEHGHDVEIRFLQEAKAAARCLHPNIATIFDFGNDGSPYIVMEYVEGVELKAHLEHHTFIELHSITDITIKVLKALSHAHDNGIVHRDIKPANVILLENGDIKVSDFGVARLDTSDLTGTGFMVGTPNYMSPEALLGRQVDARSDLYSTAVLFFELLTHVRPFRDKSLDASLKLLHEVKHLSPQNIQSIRSIMRRALQNDPAKRYQSATAFIDDLKSIEDMDLTLATTVHFPRPTDNTDAPQTTVCIDSSTQWDDDLLSSLEQSLAQYVGPMAKFLVKKCSHSSHSTEELIANLTHHIPAAEERTVFLQNMGKSATTMSHRAAASDPATQPLSEPQLTALTKLLAFYIGPLANRLVRKMSAQHRDVESIAAALAIHITDHSEREEFLAKTQQL